MAKSKSVYVCSECGAQTPQWMGRCPACGKFGTLVEEIAGKDVEEVIEKHLPRTAVWRIDLEQVSGRERLCKE